MQRRSEVRHDAAGAGPARARPCRDDFFSDSFVPAVLAEGARRPADAKAAPVRRIADPRQSHRHRECGLLHASMSASTPRTPQSAPQRLFRSSAAAREPSGFQRRMCRSCRHQERSRACFHESFLVRPACRLSLRHPARTDRRAPVPRHLPASLRRLPPSQWRRLSSRVHRRHRRIARRSRTAPTR